MIDHVRRSVTLKHALRSAIFSLEYALDSMAEDSVNTRYRRQCVEKEFNRLKSILDTVEDEDAEQAQTTSEILKDCVVHRDLVIGRRA